MLQQDKPDDYVIATGQQISVRDFLDKVFAKLQMNVVWSGADEDEIGTWIKENGEKQIVVRIDSSYFRPTEVETLLGDITKAKKKLKWEPSVTIDQLVSEMVENDLKNAKNELLIKNSNSIGDKDA